MLFRDMIDRYKSNGREGLFNYILNKYNIKKEGLLERLLGLYRAHEPAIRLYEDATSVIHKLKLMKIKTGLITDGMKFVQHRKVLALGLDKMVDSIIFTEDLGPDCSKPSVVPFKAVCCSLQVKCEDACYIGDNPFKDFLGPNELKMASIRLKRGLYKNAMVEGDLKNNSLTKISSLEDIFLIQGLYGSKMSNI